MANPLKSLARRLLRFACAAWLQMRSAQLPRPAPGTKTLVIAPHQDDETLGCGGLIARRIQEKQPVEVAYITDGAGSHPSHPRVTPAELAQLRRAEAVSALQVLGVPADGMHFFGAPDGQLPHLEATARERLIAEIAALLVKLQPSQVFLPGRQDGSSEHHAAFSLVSDALARCGSAATLFQYPVWSWWNPRYLVAPTLRARRAYRLAVGPNAAAKARALAQYRSQTEPLAPWTTPALSREFVEAFGGGQEYFFTD